MRIPIYQVDAFTSQRFHGNPAAICPLEEWLPDETLQAIAAENNLAETAYFLRRSEGVYELRWFTPAVEVDLCGHATMASAYVLWNCLGFDGERVGFDTRSGRMWVTRDGAKLALDFPSRPPAACTPCTGLVEALGGAPQQVLAARDYFVVYRTAAEVLALQPDMQALCGIDRFAVIVTAPGGDCDFVSRFFAPAKGVPEDPVTGSAHCSLIPYWAERLGKSQLFARQVSKRGGELYCELRGDRVRIAGEGVLYLEGNIEV